MAAIDYSAFVELADELIEDSGRELIFQRLSSTAADASKPWQGAATPTVVETVSAVPGVFVPASGSGLGRNLVSDELLKKVDQVVLVAGRAEDLEDFDLVVDADVKWRIEWAQVLRPGDLVVLYFFGVCR